MAKEKNTRSEANKILKLHELPFESMIEIGGHEFQFKGYAKRKTEFGNVEHFIFECEKPKHEKIIPRFSNATIKIKFINGKYKM